MLRRQSRQVKESPFRYSGRKPLRQPTIEGLAEGVLFGARVVSTEKCPIRLSSGFQPGTGRKPRNSRGGVGLGSLTNWRKPTRVGKRKECRRRSDQSAPLLELLWNNFAAYREIIEFNDTL